MNVVDSTRGGDSCASLRGMVRPGVPGGARGRERGVALLTALLLVLAVLMTGIAAARSAIGGARVTQHELDRMLALHGAMAGLADAEHDIEGGADPGSARAAALARADADAFADACGGRAPYGGLCRHGTDGEALAAALADPDGPGVPLGAHTGARIPSGSGALAALPPRYLIELMPSSPDALLYRITALGFGSATTTQVALQAYYRKLLEAAPEGEGPGAAPRQPGGPDVPGAPGAPAAPAAPDGTDDGPAAPADTGPGDAGAPGADRPEAGNRPTPDAPLGAGPGPDAPPGSPGTPGGPGIRVGWREIGNWQELVAASARGEGR